MNHSTRLIASALAICVISVQHVFADQLGDVRGQPAQPVMTLVPCALPTQDIASRLPWFIKPADVVCMSVTPDDLQASARVQSLLLDLTPRMQNETSFSHARIEYDRGVTAYAEGNYADAISHLMAATSSIK
jgi:hypothetical protein